MPLLLIGIGVGLALAFALNALATPPGLPKPDKPPIAQVGEELFSLPQERWGKVECIEYAPGGYRYGVRFRNGLAIVLRDHDVAR